jgi:hypothetical protein
MNNVPLLVALPGARLICDVTYTVTERQGCEYGAGETVIDIFAIKTRGGIDMTHRVSPKQMVLTKLDICEIEAKRIFEQTEIKPKKEGTEQC